jgi:hypothetical protein
MPTRSTVSTWQCWRHLLPGRDTPGSATDTRPSPVSVTLKRPVPLLLLGGAGRLDASLLDSAALPTASCAPPDGDGRLRQEGGCIMAKLRLFLAAIIGAVAGVLR